MGRAGSTDAMVRAAPDAAVDSAAVRVLCIHQMDDSSLCTLERPVLERGHELVPWYAHREAPPPVDGFGAVIALGGTTHPDQEAVAPWLLPELELLGRLAARGVPTLGICLGAQLVARLHGALVAPLPRPEIGWFEVTREPADDPLLDGLPATFPAFQWHHYGFGVPEGAVRLAGSVQAPNQAVRVGRASWALQFHIE